MPYVPTGRPGGRPKKVQPILTDKQQQAALFRGSHPTASLAAIARAVGVSRQAVHQWMSDPHFLAACERYDVVKKAKYVVAKLQKQNQEREAARDAWYRKFYGTRDFALESLRWTARRERDAAEAIAPNTWSVESMADGKVYTDPDKYVDSLETAGMFPVAHLPEVGSPEWAEFSRFLVARGKK